MDYKKLILVIFIIFILAYIIAMAYQSIEYNDSINGNEKTQNITIKEKFIKGNPNTGLDEYLIVDSNNNIYKDVDDRLRNKTNSSDVYVSLEIGKKYEVYTVGERTSVISQYPNIISIKLLN